MGEIEQAVTNHEWQAARMGTAVKLARMMDETTSARDAKACGLSLIKLISELEQAEREDEMMTSTPLASILQLADEV